LSIACSVLGEQQVGVEEALLRDAGGGEDGGGDVQPAEEFVGVRAEADAVGGDT
jgi:hypothetical protein